VRVEDGPELLAEAGDVAGRAEGDRVRVVVRAERLLLAERHEPADDVTVIEGQVSTVDYQGQVVRYFIDAGPLSIQAINTIDRHPFSEGATVQARIRAQDCVLLEGAAD